MSTLTQLFTSIANAIRTKKGTQALIQAEDFPTEISNLPVGKLTNQQYQDALDLTNNILGADVAYTPIEYIEATGTQYIDPNKFTTADFGFDIDVSISSNTGGNLFGGNLGNSNPYFALRDGYCRYFYSNGTPYIQFSSIDYNNRHTYKFIVENTQYSYYYDNTLIGNIAITHPSNVEIAFFSFRDGNGVIRTASYEVAKCKLYDFKIYSGRTLINHYIPVKDKNNVACLFDKLTNNYLYNAGTGDFVAGPELQ